MPSIPSIFARLSVLWQRYIGARVLAHPFWSALLCGLILPLSYPPFYLLPLFYLATSLVFYLTVQKLTAFSVWQLARLGWCFGFGQFASGMAWIGEAFLVEAELFLWALPIAVTGLPAGLALLHAASFALFGALAKRSQPSQLGAYILLALLLALSEYARSHVLTGLPEFAAHGLGRMALSGAAGSAYRHLRIVAFGAVECRFHGCRASLICAGRFWLCRRRFRLFFICPIGGPAAPAAGALKITVVQPNLAQREKWRPGISRPSYRQDLQNDGAGLAICA